MNGIHSIKDRTSVNIFVSDYGSEHVMFNKGEYIGHLKNINEEENSQPHENSDVYTSSVTMKRMMSEQVELDTFEPPCHKLKPNIKTKLEALLKEYNSQFA